MSILTKSPGKFGRSIENERGVAKKFPGINFKIRATGERPGGQRKKVKSGGQFPKGELDDLLRGSRIWLSSKYPIEGTLHRGAGKT
jgi:hypothetical protein